MKHILLFLLVFGTVLCPAETKKQAKHPQPERQTTPHYDTTLFDISRETLPPNYLGIDIAMIVSRLLKVESSLHKSDYETTDAFNARQAAAFAVPLIATVGASDPIAFVVSAEQKYWADANELDIWVNIGPLVLGPTYELRTPADKEDVLIEVRQANVGTYQGANAFGAQRTVSMSDMTTYRLAMPTISSTFRVKNHPYELMLGAVGESDAILVRFRMSPVEALELRDTVRALFVVRLEPPYVYHWDDYSTPTFSNPSLDTSHHHILYARPIALWFFNSKTGAILKTISISPLQSAPKLAPAKPEQCSNIALGKQNDASQSLRNSFVQHLTAAQRAEGQVLVWMISPPTGTSPEDFAAVFKKGILAGVDGESAREKLRSYGFTQICLETGGKSFEWPI